MQNRDIRRTLILLLALGVFLQPISSPVWAQEEDDGIEIEENDGKGGDPSGKGKYDAEETRRKNSGLAGGGPQDDGDAHAPKVKLSLQQQINKAIKDGVEWLKKRQGKDGSWGPVRANRRYGESKASGNYIRDELGPTAWSVYTLSKCGVPAKDPVVRKGLKFISDQTRYVFDEMGGKAAKRDDLGKDGLGQQRVAQSSPRALTTYESAAIILMIEAAYQRSEKLTKKHKVRKWKTKMLLSPPKKSKIPKKAWGAMHDRIMWLTYGRKIRPKAGGGTTTINGTLNVKGPNNGGWRYGQANGDADLSATQFVLLAFRAASQAGYPMERLMRNGQTVWERTAKYVMNCQNQDGGFRYQTQPGKTTGSMTACGIASLVICKEQIELVNAERGKKEPQIEMPSGIAESIERGKKWLDLNFTVKQNPGGSHHYYYLYGVERVGDLTARKEFNSMDWYVRGARLLIPAQAGDGSWTDQGAYPPRDVLGSCYALLFLKRATPPVVTTTER